MEKHKNFLHKFKTTARKFTKTARFRNILIIIIPILILAALGILFFLQPGQPENQSSGLPEILVSSSNLLQADILLVVVKNEPYKVEGSFNLNKIYFFKDKINHDWISIIGIPINEKPGNYKLTVGALNKTLFEKNITIQKRNFPITAFNLSPALIQQGYTPKKIITNIVSKENVELNKILTAITPTAYFAKPFIYPLSSIKVVGKFGDIRTNKNHSIQHLGVDLKAPISTPVCAVNDGKVVFEKTLQNYGNMIIIDHGLGIYSLYLHLSEFKAINGQMVKLGDTIALSGDTGYTLGPHLHFSIKMQGNALDPLKFIKTTQENGW